MNSLTYGNRLRRNDRASSSHVKDERNMLSIVILSTCTSIAKLREAEQLRSEAKCDETKGAPLKPPSRQPTAVEAPDEAYTSMPSRVLDDVSTLKASSAPSEAPENESEDWDSTGDDLPNETGEASNENRAIVKHRRVASQPEKSPSRHRTSDMLMQMVPYRREIPISRSNSQMIVHSENKSGTMAEEASNTIDLLLNKWTVSGSQSVAEALAKEQIPLSKKE